MLSSLELCKDILPRPYIPFPPTTALTWSSDKYQWFRIGKNWFLFYLFVFTFFGLFLGIVNTKAHIKFIYIKNFNHINYFILKTTFKHVNKILNFFNLGVLALYVIMTKYYKIYWLALLINASEFEWVGTGFFSILSSVSYQKQWNCYFPSISYENTYNIRPSTCPNSK